MPVKIDGSTCRSFIFPDGLERAFGYFSNLDLIFTWLPHIAVIKKYGGDSYRLQYSTIELGVYRVRIVCDVQSILDTEARILRLIPQERPDQIASSFGLHSIQAQGTYSSESRFIAEGSHTRIDYSLRLQASLPTPLGAFYMPGSMRNRIASRITTWRIREIADGFVERSIKAFHQA
jgi:hypothetical protein